MRWSAFDITLTILHCVQMHSMYIFSLQEEINQINQYQPVEMFCFLSINLFAYVKIYQFSIYIFNKVTVSCAQQESFKLKWPMLYCFHLPYNHNYH